MTKIFPVLCVVAVMGFFSDANAAKRALVYQGTGACEDGCHQAAYAMAIKAGLDPVYVGPAALNAKTTAEDAAKLFADAAVWIQPGGKSRIVVNTMTVQLKEALQKFVSNGGGYVGFCAGAFAATELVGTSSYAGFNFMPGKTTLYPSRRAVDIIPIQWNGTLRHIYWEGGPYLSELPVGQVEIRATYPNGQVAAARSQFGKGRVYVTGLHPEAPQDWRDYSRLIDKDGLDDDLVMEMIDWAKAN